MKVKPSGAILPLIQCLNSPSDQSASKAFSNLLEDEIAQEDFYMNVGGGEVVITTNYLPILTSNSNHWLHWTISDLSYHQQSEHPSSFPSISPIDSVDNAMLNSS